MSATAAPRALAAAAACLGALAGCYGSPDVTLYEPGVYKGEQDPLLETQRSAEQQRRLRERFELVQTDR
jgi:hypothetical protein